jgi:uncharacterized protein YbbK (DUF523 family)
MQHNADLIILKDRRPPCGVYRIYHGKNLISGTGVACALPLRECFEVLSSEEIYKLHA